MVPISFIFKKMISLTIAITVAMFLGGCEQRSEDLRLATGETIPMSALKNHWLYIHYWAEWCESCLNEIKHFNALKKIGDKEKIIVLGVHFDPKSPEELLMMSKRLHIRFPLLVSSPQQVFQLGDIQAVPATFVINPEGKLIQSVYGPQTQEQLLRLREKT